MLKLKKWKKGLSPSAIEKEVPKSEEEEPRKLEGQPEGTSGQNEKLIEKKQAERKEEDREGFIRPEILFSTLSHELRTPLNGVLGMAQILREEMGDSEFLETLEGSARQMQSVLHNMVNFSKIQSNLGDLPAHKEWLNVHDSLNQFAKNLNTRAAVRQLKIAVKHQDKRLRVRADLDHMSSIVESAILASLECTLPTKRDKIATLAISWKKEDDMIKIVIENPLEEMRQNRIARIEDVSQKVKGAHHASIQMEFLYWAVSTSLLEQYDGAMCAMPMEGGLGVTTQLTFKMECMNASVSDAKPIGGLSLSTGQIKHGQVDVLPFQKRVLLVEDDPVSKKITTFLLERIGQEVAAVSNGKEAVELLSEGENFNLILMDIDMPVLDGISATQAIREGEGGTHNKEIPIAALTAFNTLSDSSKFKKAGMNFMTSKPISTKELRSILFEVERIENKKLPN